MRQIKLLLRLNCEHQLNTKDVNIFVIIIIIIIIIIITFMQVIYSYILETNHVPMVSNVASILFLHMC